MDDTTSGDSQFPPFRGADEPDDIHRRFGKLVEYATDVISVFGADGTFRYMTPSSKRVLGYPPEELIGERWFGYVHPDDRAAVMETFYGGIEDPDGRPTVEFKFKHRDGSWPVLEARTRNLLDDPAIEGMVVYTRDVTERRDREARLRRQNERLEEFANVVSHDLRNPLNVAAGHLELARETGRDDHFEAVELALDRMDEIIEDVLALARQGGRIEDPEPVSLAGVAEAAWSTVGGESATLRIGDLGTVSGDRSRVRQLLENLFRNAVEHAGPDVTVRMGALEGGFYVEDEGPGIPPGDRSSVLTSGYSTSEEGSGFGLSIVREIAGAHGWSVEVAEADDGGARFEFTGVEPASSSGHPG